MTKSKVKTKTAGELQSLAENNQLDQLKDALSLLHSWGIHDPRYLSILRMLLFHKDPEVVRLTLGIMLNYAQSKVEEFSELKEYLPVFQVLLATQPLALDLILVLCGPSQDLVPHLKAYLARFPEEGCDLVVQFGPLAQELVPDLIRIIERNDWDGTWAAIDALGAIGPFATEAVPILKELTRHQSGVITGRACVALESITGISRENWPRGPSQI